EPVGREMTDHEGYPTMLARMLTADGAAEHFDVAVIDSSNQISPVMENAICPANLFVVPFESTKAVRSYANFFKLLAHLRPNADYKILHVLSNLTRLPGLRRRVIELMAKEGILLSK